MTKKRLTLLGSAVAGVFGVTLLCGGAIAQGYGYDDDVYTNSRGETVIVHAPYDRVQKQQLLGRVDGEVDPMRYSISRPVSYSDLDLSRDSDYSTLRGRIYDTARDLCRTLDEQDPALMGRADPDTDRECVRSAARDAMRQIPAG